MGIMPQGNIECTKTMMKIVHPELRSGLASALREVKKINLNKAIAHDWDAPTLSKRQIEYASGDVLELHGLLKQLREDAKWGDIDKYKKAMATIREKADLEVEGYTDLFGHQQNKYEQTLTERNWWRSRAFHTTKLVQNGD